MASNSKNVLEEVEKILRRSWRPPQRKCSHGITHFNIAREERKKAELFPKAQCPKVPTNFD